MPSLRFNKSHHHNLIQSIVESKGGKCLSHYETNYKKMKIQCANNHIFYMRPAHLKGNHWCNICSNNIISRESIIQIINEKNWECDVPQIINSKTILNCKCHKKHIFYPTVGTVYRGHGCPHCKNDKDIFYERIINIAKTNNGNCLSEKYEGCNSLMTFQCEHNHVFQQYSRKILEGHWCRQCSFDRKKCKLQEFIDIAKARGGDCLSTTYTNAFGKLLFKCKNNHIFEKKAGAIKKGQWCAQCNVNLGEGIIRYAFNKLFNIDFIKIRPDWLRFKSSANLELDGYCENLNLAFEYNGIQHYKYVKKLSKTKQRFLDQQERDRVKVELCKKQNVTLIVIPQIDNISNMKRIKEIIKWALIDKGVVLPNNFDTIELSFVEALSKIEH